MRKKIYISGPITDPGTGLPREGWQRDFADAERKLRAMGFDVMNPVEIAALAEEEWDTELRQLVRGEPPRWYYVGECVSRLHTALLYDMATKAGEGGPESPLLGLYVIGAPEDIRRSYGTMCEINFALSAGLGVWSQFCHGYAIDNMLVISGQQTLAEAAAGLSAEEMRRKRKRK